MLETHLQLLRGDSKYYRNNLGSNGQNEGRCIATYTRITLQKVKMLQYVCKKLFSGTGNISIHLYVFPYPFQISTNARTQTLVEYIRVLIPRERTAAIVWKGTRGFNLIIHRGATAVTVWTGIGCLLMGVHV